jgi:excisionase family DNA binding protein
VQSTKQQGAKSGKSRGLLTVVEFAEALGRKPATVRQMVWRRQVEFVRVGRSIRFKPETVEEIIMEGTVPVREA